MRERAAKCTVALLVELGPGLTNIHRTDEERNKRRIYLHVNRFSSRETSLITVITVTVEMFRGGPVLSSDRHVILSVSVVFPRFASREPVYDGSRVAETDHRHHRHIYIPVTTKLKTKREKEKDERKKKHVKKCSPR